MWRRIAITVTACVGLAPLWACGGGAARAPAGAGPSPRQAAADSARPPGNAAGAEDSLSHRQITARHVETIAELLEGQVPGLEVIRAPNGDISLKIRGGDLSLNNDTTYEPLLVIDGMPVSEGQVGSTLRALNPQEVARIDVLKDVSSTSMYGIRGAHGVIVITMKHQ